MEQGAAEERGRRRALVLEPALQVPGFPWEEALGAWQRPAEKRALRHVGCPGGGGVRMAWMLQGPAGGRCQ